MLNEKVWNNPEAEAELFDEQSTFFPRSSGLPRKSCERQAFPCVAPYHEVHDIERPCYKENECESKDYPFRKGESK